jgi:hypothetical protein
MCPSCEDLDWPCENLDSKRCQDLASKGCENLDCGGRILYFKSSKARPLIPLLSSHRVHRFARTVRRIHAGL